MLKVTAEGKLGAYELNLPTKISEITTDDLLYYAKDVNVADNYVLIGLLCREKLSSAIIAMKQNKAANTPAVPLFIKAGRSTNDFVNSMITKDKLIVAPSDIALGNHVTSTYNELTFNNIMSKFDGDGMAFQRISQYCKENNIDDHVYFVEFKLIPAVNIKGFYREDKEIKPNTTFIISK